MASQTTDDDAKQVLTREIGLRDWVTPTGRSVEIHYTNNLYSFKLTGSGAQPPETADRQTSYSRISAKVTEYLTKFWDMSDSKSKK